MIALLEARGRIAVMLLKTERGRISDNAGRAEHI